MTANVAVIIPTRNEHTIELARLIREITPEYHVIQVDDSDPFQARSYEGSKLVYGDGTLIGSLLKGFRYALDHYGADHIVTMDAGYSHDPAQVPLLVVPGLDCVIGSRFLWQQNGHHGPLYRQAGSRLYAGLMRATTGFQIRDWTSGFRGYSRRAAQLLCLNPPTCTRHAGQAELLLKLLHSHRAVAEVPITYWPSKSSLNLRACREAVGFAWHTAGQTPA